MTQQPIEQYWAIPPLHDYLGLVIEQEGTPSRVVVPLSDAVKGGVAPLHGGVVATMIDVASACSIGQEHYDGGFPVSTDFTVRFFRQPKESPLVAEGRVVHRGSRLIGTECVVTDGAGRQVARGQATYLVLKEFGTLGRS